MSGCTKISSVIITLILIFGCSAYSYSQDTSSARDTIENGWIEKLGTDIISKVSFSNDYETFKVDTKTNDIILYPNATMILNFGIHYRFISFSISSAPDFLPGNGDEDLKGNTKTFGIGTSLYFKHFFQDLKYSKVTGYYLENTRDYINWTKGDPYIQFSGLTYKGFSGATGYSLNSKFSVESLFAQTQRQLKSAGSLIPIISYRYYGIKDNAVATPGGSSQESKNIEMIFGTGYHYTFVWGGKFYSSIGFTPNIGFINSRILTKDAIGSIQTTQNNFAFRWDGRGALGYNGRIFYTGLNLNLSGLKFKQEGTTVMNYDTRVFYQIFLGIVINEPSSFRRFIDKSKVSVKNRLKK